MRPNHYYTPGGEGLEPHENGLAYKKVEVGAYVHALSDALVKAACVAIKEEIAGVNGGWVSDDYLHCVSLIDKIELNPEAIAAIVASVMEEK